MNRAVSALAAIALLATPGCAARRGPAASPAGGGPRLVDATADFWRFWDASLGKKDDERVRLLHDMVTAPHPDLYGEGFRVPADDRLPQYLETVSATLPQMKFADDRLEETVRAAFASFARAYPRFDTGLPVYAGPSFFAPPVQLKPIRGSGALVVGVDTLGAMSARLPDPTPLLHREMFRAYHRQVNEAMRPKGPAEEGTPLYLRLWSNGLALQAARLLDPDAPVQAILESTTLAATAEPILPRLATELRERLDSTDAADVRSYFSTLPTKTGVPPRSGWYVGMRLAENLAKERPVDDLARLAGPDLRAEVERALRALEEGKP